MTRSVLPLLFVAMGLGLAAGPAYDARLRSAEPLFHPAEVDGNSPSFWYNGRLRMFTSVGRPLQISEWDPEVGAWESNIVDVGDLADLAVWVEAAWVDDDGTVFGWYHHEPAGLFENEELTAPKIGALVSFDGGRTIHDLGIVLESGDPLIPEALNGAFAGGHGDFSVVHDRASGFFHFFFTNYGGPEETQGIAVARMAHADRFAPVGRVFKYHDGAWTEPGCGGRVTAVFPAARAWHHANPDSFWGPAVHWNAYLKRHVMLLNRTGISRGWRQEGIYLAAIDDISRPDTWEPPWRIMGPAGFPDWGTHYPQVMGLEPGTTDSLAGRVARFYVSGGSAWEIVFSRDEEFPVRLPQHR